MSVWRTQQELFSPSDRQTQAGSASKLSHQRICRSVSHKSVAHVAEESIPSSEVKVKGVPGGFTRATGEQDCVPAAYSP